MAHIRMIKPSLVTDETTWKAYWRGEPLARQWDDGFGPLWVYRDAGGLIGVVRATTWEDAYSCVVDEIMDDGTWEDAIEDLTQAQIDNGEMNDGYQFRGSGTPSNPILTSAIACEDLNGSILEPLTDTLAGELKIDIWDMEPLQGLLPPDTSRFDVVGAYYLIANRWHGGGASMGYRKLSQCFKVGLGGNLDALESDETIRRHAAALLRKRKADIRKHW